MASTPGTRAGLQPSPCLAPGALSPERVESGMRAGARAVPAQRECGARARAPDFPTEDGRTREGSLQQGLSTEMSRGPLLYLKKKKKAEKRNRDEPGGQEMKAESAQVKGDEKDWIRASEFGRSVNWSLHTIPWKY